MVPARKMIYTLLVLITCFFLNAQTSVPEVVVEVSDLMQIGIDQQAVIVFHFPENTYQGADSPLLFIKTNETSGLELKEINWPTPLEEDGILKYKGKTEVKILLTGWDNLAEAQKESAEIIIGYQICDLQGVCYFPEEVSLTLISPQDGITQTDTLSWITVLQYLLLAFAGGLILNVMPCVLPVLSLKALSLLNLEKGSRKEILKHGALYSAGIIASMAILGILVLFLKIGGEQVGWGFQFQNSGFILFLLGILVFFALSLFDLFIINLPGLTTLSSMSGKGGKSGYSGAFLSGIFAVLLATPCTAPVLGSALGFAFSAPAPLIPFFFITVGAGLALPFLVISLFPKLIRKLPKPGPWMEHFKKAMGFLLLLAVLWLLDVLYWQLGWSGVVRTLLWLLAMFVSSWIYGTFGQFKTRKRSRLILSLSILIFLSSTYIFLIHPGNQTESEIDNTLNNANLLPGYIPFSEEAVAAALNEGNSVFISFSAKWCLTCQVNEKTVLATESVQTLFDQNKVTRFYGDFTKYNPVIAQWLEDHGRAGVPLYLYYPEGASTPVVLPEILTHKMIQDLLAPN